MIINVIVHKIIYNFRCIKGGDHPLLFSKTGFEIGLVRGRYTQGATFETKFVECDDLFIQNALFDLYYNNIRTIILGFVQSIFVQLTYSFSYSLEFTVLIFLDNLLGLVLTDGLIK